MAHRPMRFADSWYPGNGADCEKRIRQFWGKEHPREAPRGPFGVAPHAGWVYSGLLAARVWQALETEPPVELVIVMGGHLHRDDPLLAMTEGAWETPFGPMTMHGGFRDALEGMGRVEFEREGHYREDNSTELHLPFAKYKYPQAELLVLRVPPGPLALETGQALASYLKKGPRAVAVASTDLTHYGPNYHFTPQGAGKAALNWVREVNDPAFIHSLEAGDGAAILAGNARNRNACSAGGVAALNEIARAGGLSFTQLGYATSAEFGAGDRENFVGYLGGVYC